MKKNISQQYLIMSHSNKKVAQSNKIVHYTTLSKIYVPLYNYLGHIYPLGETLILLILQDLQVFRSKRS